MSETKHERFKRLAAQRTNGVLDRLRVLGNCSNPASYEYHEDDIKKIFNSIEQELQSVKSKFKNSKSKKLEF